MKKVLLRASAALVALALSVYAAELLVRALDPHGISDTFNAERYRNEAFELCGPPRIFKHKPGVELELRGFHLTTDSRGARGPARDFPKPEGVKRAVFLGDSVTLGWGVSDEDTFVALLEEELSRASGEPWQTVNLGGMFHDTTMEVGAFAEVGPSYEPDLVVLVFVDNDVVPTGVLMEQQATADPLNDPGVSDEAKEVLRMAQRLGRLRPYLPYLSALLTFEYVTRHPAGQTGSTEHAEAMGLDVEAGWEACRTAIAALDGLVAATGAKLVILDHVTQGFDRLESFCAESGIAYGKLDYTADERAQDIRNSDADAHANPRGHRFLAGHAVRELIRIELP